MDINTIVISKGCTKARVVLSSSPVNPYKSILGETLWGVKSPPERFVAIKERLGRGDKSLDKALFTFYVEGLPRHQFAQHSRARIGVSFSYSDPDWRPQSYLPYTSVFDKMFRGFQAGSHDGGYFEDPGESIIIRGDGDSFRVRSESETFATMTDFGEKVVKQFLSIPRGGWKEIRDYLPLCYEQTYSFEIEFRALIGQCARRLCLGEEAQIVTNHYLQKAALADKFPMLASSLRPACSRSEGCLYSKSYTLSNAFGCLFAGCNHRHPKGTSYASFNQSCSDISVLRKEVKPEGIIDKMDLLETPGSLDQCDDRDKDLFLSD